MNVVRFRLEPSDVQPIAFEWNFEQAVPPFLEDRDRHRSRPDGARVDADIVRYHQAGVAHGWVEVDGSRVEFGPDVWVSTRDHSWGVRYQVGAPPADAREPMSLAGIASLIMWCPVLMERADGSRYALHWFFQRHALTGWQRVEFQGGAEHPDGRKDHFAACVPELRVRDDNRRVLGGVLHFSTNDGAERPVTIEADLRHRISSRHRPLSRLRRQMARAMARRAPHRGRVLRRLFPTGDRVARAPTSRRGRYA